MVGLERECRTREVSDYRIPLYFSITGNDTVDPLIVDSPKYGHSITNLSTKDTTCGLSIIPMIHNEPPEEENLSTKKKSAEFMMFPKCP